MWRVVSTTLIVGGALLIGLLAASAAPKQVRNSDRYVPPSAPKSVQIGNFYFRRKDYRGALSRYQEAVKTDSMYAPAYLGLGRVYEKLGRKRRALKAYREYLDKLPSEKQAEEDKEAHKAIRRLERQLAQSRKAAPSRKVSPPSHR